MNNLLQLFQQYIERKYRHAKIDQGITFKLDPSLKYIELTFDGPQSKPTTGWSVHPHLDPCRVNNYMLLIAVMHYWSRRM